MAKWNVDYFAGGTLWTDISSADVDRITEELNGHEEALFRLPNNATNRALVGTNRTLRIKFDGTEVFTGVLYGAEYSPTEITAITYNDVIERFRRGVITGTIPFPEDPTDILNYVNNYSSGTIAVGTAPTTPNLTLKLDYTTCLDTTKALAESLNMDWWGDTITNGIGYIHIGTKGATSSVGTVTQSGVISSRGIDRAKNRDKIYVIGTDKDGNRLIGTAGAGSNSAVFTRNKAADQTTLNNIAAKKLADINKDCCGVSLKVASSVAYNLHSGDVLTVQSSELDLNDDFRIKKIEKGAKTTTIEVDRKKDIIDKILQQQNENITTTQQQQQNRGTVFTTINTIRNFNTIQGAVSNLD